MFDCHYDLLTFIYINKNNPCMVKQYCNKIFQDNLCGGIFNLFYMSPKEMQEELGISESEINIVQNLKDVSKIIKTHNLIPSNINYIYGIEGLDYLDNINDLDTLYSLGVRSVNIVWNNDNKFGGGIRGNKNQGLTTLGEKLVNILVSKKIAIDLSHANTKTFYNIIEHCTMLKSKGHSPIVFASHSNAKSICNVPRNLSDNQILKIKELDGIIGIVGVKPFCLLEKSFNTDYTKYYNAYLNHIIHVKKLLGGLDNIAISTDDMSYYKINTDYYKNFNVFPQEKMKQLLSNLLLENNFSKTDVEKILYKNFLNKIMAKL